MNRRASSRQGFTIVELVLATGITALIFGGVGTLLVGSYRFSRLAMTETELAIRLRDVRERLQFRTRPVKDGTVWSGILSANGKGTEGGFKVLVTGKGTRLSDGVTVDQPIQLVTRFTSIGGVTRGRFVNDGDGGRSRETWMQPYGGYYLRENEWLNDDRLASDKVFFVTHEVWSEYREIPHGVVRHDRVALPLFGEVQPKNSIEIFKD